MQPHFNNKRESLAASLTKFKHDLRSLERKKRKNKVAARPEMPASASHTESALRVKDTRLTNIHQFPMRPARLSGLMQAPFASASSSIDGPLNKGFEFNAGWWLLPSVVSGSLIWVWLISLFLQLF